MLLEKQSYTPFHVLFQLNETVPLHLESRHIK